MSYLTSREIKIQTSTTEPVNLYETRHLPSWLSAALFVLLIGVCTACGPRLKSAEMVSFEQQMMNRVQLQKLQGQCPDLVSESLKYYQRALQEYESNETEESAYYIKLAQITWQTAEMRTLYLEHRTFWFCNLRDA